MSEKIIFSWSTIGHEQAKIYCQNTLKNGMLHHALLFSGPDSIGKTLFACDFAQIILCNEYHRQQSTTTTNFPCYQCSQCHFVEKHIHPDLHHLKPQQTKSSPTITIELIRELKTKLALKTSNGGKRIILIENIEHLTTGASNALLKLLEEPSPTTHFLLTTSQKNHLLPTLRSRLPILHFSRLSYDQIRDSLLQQNASLLLAKELAHLASGRMGVAFRFLEQPSVRQTHQQWIDQILSTIASHPPETFHQLPTILPSKERSLEDNRNILFYWITLFRDLIILRSRSQIPLTHETRSEQLTQISKSISLQTLLHAFNRLAQFQEPASLSHQPQLSFENILFSLKS